ncbi:branched-chain amino acid ABC transporter permease [Variovorax paradoxus]|jgi:branched-chain amino acid transport system permease protein|uniref:branched-chain amino acid ABC transporter permease n=1 Tax=Variovorax paradoxus TaxID=34073 RepID=UPI0003FCCFE0|nr:branched-chain amino acid ABC transporter permease [Variovorax paradoxus]
MRRSPVLLFALGLLTLLPAMGVGGYVLNILVMIFIFAILAVSLDLVMGWAGQFSFAHAAFFGIGAYTTAILQRDFGTGFGVNLPVGMVLAGLCGLLLGLPALRLRGHFLAIVTIAFQTIVYLALTQWKGLTGGQFGIEVQPVPGFASIGRFYYLALGLSVASIAIGWCLTHSRLGMAWQAVRDDEVLARAIGLNTTASKLTAFVIASALAGAAGVLVAHHIRGVTPDDFTVLTSATIVAMVVVGGRGTIWGPLLGAAVLTALPEVLGFAADYKLMIFGLLMVLMVIVMPQGVFGAWVGRTKK